MWRDICTANRDGLLDELDRYLEKLRSVRPLVESGDGAALEKLFAEARAARERWLSGEYE
jgi:prephenate dehydrogenase